MIVSIDVSVVPLGLIEDQHMGGTRTSGIQNSVFVRVGLASGIYGYGEASSWPLFGGELHTGMYQVISELFAPHYLGKNEAEWLRLRNHLDAIIPGNNLAKSAIDMATIDAFTKSLHIPAAALFGSPGSMSMTLSYSVSLQNISREKHLLEEKLDAGYTIFKLKVGVSSPSEDVDRLLQLREVAPNARIRLDYNEAATDAHLARIHKVALDVNVEYCEQPFPRKQIDRLLRLRKWFKIPVSLDESISCVEELDAAARLGLCDVVSIKLGKVGGFSPAFDLIRAAERHGIAVYPGSLSETHLGVGAAMNLFQSAKTLVPGCDFYFPFEILGALDLEGGPLKQGGAIVLSGHQGIGTTVPEDWFHSGLQFHKRVVL